MLQLVASPALVARIAAAGHARATQLYDARAVAASVLAALDL
jgi:hypothetical protein